MRLTAKKLIDAGCCSLGVERYFQLMNRKQWDAEKLFDMAIKTNMEDTAYGIVYLMTQQQRVQWAAWCAERALKFVSAKDKRRANKVLMAIKTWLKDPSEKNTAAAENTYFNPSAVKWAPRDAVRAVTGTIGSINNCDAIAYMIEHTAYATEDPNKTEAQQDRANNAMYRKCLRKGRDIILNA